MKVWAKNKRKYSERVSDILYNIPKLEYYLTTNLIF